MITVAQRYLILLDAEGTYFALQGESDFQTAMLRELELIVCSLRSLDANLLLTVVDMHAAGNNLTRAACTKLQLELVPHLWNLHSFNFTAALLLGMHGRSGSSCQQAHSFFAEVKDIYLGDKVVGEFGLLENWLAYLGIPLALVCGTAALENELLTSPSQFVNVAQYSSPANYRQGLSGRLAQALSAPPLKSYNPAPVSLSFNRPYYLEAIPESLFNKTKTGLSFVNTSSFIAELLPLSFCLHNATACFRARANALVKAFRAQPWIHERCLQEERCNLLLSQDLAELSFAELTYLNSRLVIEKEKDNHEL